MAEIGKPRTSGRPATRVRTMWELGGYSSSKFESQRSAQDAVVDSPRVAAAKAGLPITEASVQQGGDSELIRWPAGVTAAEVLARFIPALRAELDVTNARLEPAHGLGSRCAVVVGSSEEGKGGLIGQAPIAVARLVEAPVSKKAVAVAPASLAVIVSDDVCTDTIEPRVSSLEESHYRGLRIRMPEKGFSSTAWMNAHPVASGSPVFSDNRGAHSGAGRTSRDTIRGLVLRPKSSGMTSVNALHPVETAPWTGLYSPANTFLNGDVLGDPPGSADVDPKVPAC